MMETETGVFELGSSAGRPDIFGYRDYRRFLKDLFSYLKKREDGFSIRKLAEQAEISIGYISTVVNSAQPISEKALEKILPHLAMSPAERSFFKLLCIISDSKSQEERMEAVRRLQKFRYYKEMNTQDAKVFRYFTKWYYVAINELANVKDFRPDSLWVQGRLRFFVPLQEIDKALEFLFENKMISMQPDGTYKASAERIVSEGDVFSISLAQFHKQIFELSAAAIEKVPKAERSIKGHTFPISKEKFEEVKKILDEALEKVAQLSEADPNPTAVYHCSFIGIPITRPSGEENS
jgi:uncharacterized protein (TIGR02147 family)